MRRHGSRDLRYSFYQISDCYMLKPNFELSEFALETTLDEKLVVQKKLLLILANVLLLDNLESL